MSKTTKKYTGELAKGRLPPKGEDATETFGAVAIHCFEGIDLLCEHYGIKNDDPTKWMLLTFKLAIEHVPYFKMRGRKRGPRESETFHRYMQLAHDVSVAKLDGVSTDLEALAVVSRLPRWRDDHLPKSLQKMWGRMKNVEARGDGSAYLNSFIKILAERQNSGKRTRRHE